MSVETPFVLQLLTLLALGYGILSYVPRVDEQPDGLRKFFALTTMGISYLVLLVILLALGDGLSDQEPVEALMWLALAGYFLFGLTLLYDVFDDWLRLFGDPDYNTLVEASLVLALIVLLVAFLLLVP